jgi:hypothetical protein
MRYSSTWGDEIQQLHGEMKYSSYIGCSDTAVTWLDEVG